MTYNKVENHARRKLHDLISECLDTQFVRYCYFLKSNILEDAEYLMGCDKHVHNNYKHTTYFVEFESGQDKYFISLLEVGG